MPHAFWRQHRAPVSPAQGEFVLSTCPDTLGKAPSFTPGWSRRFGEGGHLASYLALAVFLLAGTGFATDDYVHLWDGLTRRLADNLLPREYVSVPLLHYTHGLAYFAIGDRIWGYDVLKIAYAGLGIFFSSRFFACFVPPQRALLLGFAFIFMPLHDGATYSLTHQYLIVSFSSLLYAYALGAEARYRLAIAFALLGSFTSYGSPPIAFGLAVLAWAKGRRMVAATILGPNLLYVAYYLATSLLFQVGTQRLTGEAGVAALVRQFLLQLATFADASLGPSGWSKMYNSIAALDAIALLAAVGATVLICRQLSRESGPTAERLLPIAAAIVLLGAFAMFALTGLYPQLAFGLGDRVMIYGDFFLVCLLGTLRLPRLLAAVLVALLCLAVAGISTHWKEWRQETGRVAARIKGNEALRGLPAGTLLFVAGHQYSRLGPYCHIEFFTTDYVVQTYFKLSWGSEPVQRLRSFNRRLEYRDGMLYDRKYGESNPVSDGIWVYDSDRDALEWVQAQILSVRIQQLPDETRHWTQRLGDGWIRDRLMDVVPRLRYAY